MSTATAPSISSVDSPVAASTDRLAAARERFAPLFAEIAAGAASREASRELPVDEIRRLAAAGFGALRLDVSEGGGGLTAGELVELLIDLGAADANLPQIWRNHIAFVEDRLWHREGGADDVWIARIAQGAFVGGAWSERATVPGARSSTRFDASTRPPTVSGTKYYSTGSLYADWITVTAKTDDGADVLVVVDASEAGVVRHDDWGGIGQRLTASGTTELRDVPVAGDAVFPDGGRSPHQETIYQLVLVAAVAGVAVGARDDGAAAVRARVRNYPQGLAALPREDAIVQETIGGVAAAAAAARAVVVHAARELDAGLEALRAARASAEGLRAEDARGSDLLHPAAVATYEAQIVTADAALRASTELFDALGSSSVEHRAGLDRHWRNARTLISHNPRGYKARLLGDWYVNGADPDPWAARHEPLPDPAEREPGADPDSRSAPGADTQRHTATPTDDPGHRW
ncbi:monooxygenase [Microbacterium forte]|uniref:monooxygenase n=1 Tax=Microbacterium forte TaxID=2982533 RepID=UPI002892A00D|nr:monooxygenase [Microbacterium sp. A(2022)]